MPLLRLQSNRIIKKSGRSTTTALVAREKLTMSVNLALLIPLCCLLLAVADLVIVTIPLRFLIGWLGAPIGSRAYTPILSTRQTVRARRNARALAISARLVPFRADCYPKALVAVLLGFIFGIPTAVHFGARTLPKKTTSVRRMEGHVWVISGRVCASGGVDSYAQFPTVACFMRQNSR